MRIIRYHTPAYRSAASSQNGLARSPWSGLETEIDRLFQSAVGTFADSHDATHFPVDLYEDKDATYLRAELPGVNRDDIQVELVEGYLTISASSKQQASEAEAPKASSGVSYTRSIAVPGDVQADRIAAAYEYGVLTVTLPKREEAKPKKVTVAVK
jgi:HSP20 family protein